MKILVDTNVLLSAAWRDRLPEKVVLYVAGENACHWIATPDIYAEYLEVLRRPKFGLSQEVLHRWSALIEMRTILVSSPSVPIDFPRDPKDVPFFSAALVTMADFLITGDLDLLNSKITFSTRIVSVSDFAREFGIVS
jgi:putative PIN family toxin of toxin-antitoxin system